MTFDAIGSNDGPLLLGARAEELAAVDEGAAAEHGCRAHGAENEARSLHKPLFIKESPKPVQPPRAI
jgi:hypothetical protein